jgi:O-antigen/teichoic acid export membrane protein
VLIPAVIGLSILVRPLLLVLGKDYSTQSATLVVLLAVSSIPLTFQGIAVGVLKARARIKSLLVTGVVFTVLHLGFSAWLVSYWGLTGVGIAVILARTLSAALAFLLAFGDKLPARFSGIFNHLWTNE